MVLNTSSYRRTIHMKFNKASASAWTCLRAVQVALLLCPFGFTLTTGAQPAYPEGRVIVHWHKGTSLQHREQSLRGVGASSVHHFRFVDASAVRLPSASARG